MKYGGPKCNCGFSEGQEAARQAAKKHPIEPLTSKERLGPPDIMCPKCGEYIMCPDVYEQEIERLTANLDAGAATHKRMTGERDRLGALLKDAREYVYWYDTPKTDELAKRIDEALAGAADSQAIACNSAQDNKAQPVETDAKHDPLCNSQTHPGFHCDCDLGKTP